ncbi:hypothetical protein MA04_01444 [Alcanivorax balearicus MACL04]|uniref:Type II secretion system protein GspF domain-containing protein n=1 Tax=Alloalcanivorax balearicus MACL04 TaxID=1177182 RepID=A0ABT2QXA5_9GAMM|nr:type II secretion system F family protein [Alloalcanivorax balearicus]MCU5782144.1 hypothetical protein [Alloalcanivorax balearicus MACL04]
MTADALLGAARNLAILAVVLIVAQLLWVALREKQRVKRNVAGRLQIHTELPGGEETAHIANGRYQRFLVKAGMSLDQSSLVMGMLLIFATAGLVLVFLGPLWLPLVPVSALLLLALLWKVRYERRRRIIFESLPGLIDNVIRGIDAGRSLDQAMVDSFRDAPSVYEALSFRIRSAVESGRDYTDLLDDFAELYQIPPLVFVAVALRTSNRFGSAVRPILKQTSRALRAQQELRREFMAATAETRFTAIAFSVLPPGIGVVLIAMNKGFRDILLDTQAGHIMLAVSGGLVLLGVIIIFRMVQGVGRG